MLRADKVLPAGDWTGTPVDSVVLDFDERYRRRFVMTGVGGLAFLLDLPEAAMLRGGDGLKLEDGRIVEVVAAPEPLAEIRAADPLALMRVAWHLGNRHLPTEMTAEGPAHPPRSGHRGHGQGPRRPRRSRSRRRSTRKAAPMCRREARPAGRHDHHGHDHGHGHAHDDHDHDDHDHHDHDHAPRSATIIAITAMPMRHDHHHEPT